MTALISRSSSKRPYMTATLLLAAALLVCCCQLSGACPFMNAKQQEQQVPEAAAIHTGTHICALS